MKWLQPFRASHGLPLLVLVLLPSFPAAGREADERLPSDTPWVSARVREIEVFGGDFTDVRFVASMAEQMLRRLQRTVPAAANPGRPLHVYLQQSGHQSHHAPFATQGHRDGGVSLYFRWDRDLSRAMTEWGLAQALFARMSLAQSGGAEIHVPFWVEMAVMHLIRQQSVPTHSHHLRDLMRDGRIWQLEEILMHEREREPETDGEFAANAFWLFLFLEREGRGRNLLDNFLVRLSRGESEGRALGATFGPRFLDPAEVGIWWLVGVHDLLEQPRSPVATAGQSLRRLEEWSLFSFIDDDRLERRISPGDLWRERNHAGLRAGLEQRLRLLNNEVGSAHPFFQNAFLSLGLLMESVLRENQEAHDPALGAWLRDFADGRDLMRETTAVLDEFCPVDSP